MLSCTCESAHPAHKLLWLLGAALGGALLSSWALPGALLELDFVALGSWDIHFQFSPQCPSVSAVDSMSLRPRAETAVRRLRWKSDFEKKCLVRVALIFER